MIFFSSSPLEGAIPRSSSAQVNIRAPGNSKPQFSKKVYHGTVEEEQDPGVTIVKVSLHEKTINKVDSFKIILRFPTDSM